MVQQAAGGESEAETEAVVLAVALELYFSFCCPQMDAGSAVTDGGFFGDFFEGQDW